MLRNHLTKNKNELTAHHIMGTEKLGELVKALLK
jgi:hypothetical protein